MIRTRQQERLLHYYKSWSAMPLADFGGHFTWPNPPSTWTQQREQFVRIEHCPDSLMV